MYPEDLIEKITNNLNKSFNYSYCPSCGAKITKNSNFCEKCGKSLKSKDSTEKEEKTEIKKESKQKKDEPIKKSKKIVIKCPNCNNSLKSFESECPYCHTELRNIKASDSLENFSRELTKLQTRPLPQYQGEESLMKRLIGQDLNYENKETFEKQVRKDRENEISRFISNYPIPNTKEDLLEFMILARSNYDISDSYTLRKTWESKMKQILEKANLSLKHSKDLDRITELYEKRKSLSSMMRIILKKM